jgi:hypothetical protein
VAGAATEAVAGAEAVPVAVAVAETEAEAVTGAETKSEAEAPPVPGEDGAAPRGDGSKLPRRNGSKLPKITKQEQAPALQSQTRDQEAPVQTNRRFETTPGLGDDGFSDCDVAYVENAGLVLLWPFLSPFFERLGLMADEGFKTAATRQRAVGLLAYLADANPSPLEYQVTLAKILCGQELSEVFDFGEPVTEAEAQECENLLTAVIAQAPILKNMSAQGLRGTFLLRQGMLETEAGAWLLRVERETYDLVLDSVPWETTWVRLPFMEAPLQVEW